MHDGIPCARRPIKQLILNKFNNSLKFVVLPFNAFKIKSRCTCTSQHRFIPGPIPMKSRSERSFLNNPPGYSSKFDQRDQDSTYLFLLTA